MNQRENILSLFHRQGYEFAPVYFNLCPALVEEFKKRYGDRNYEEVFDFPYRYITDRTLAQNFNDWTAYHKHNTYNAESTYFDCWGIGREKTPESMHMSRMLHPMSTFAELRQFEEYPYPQFDESHFEETRSEILKIQEAGYAAFCSMSCTIWEIAWYMRSMEEMMIGMMTDDPPTAYHLDRITELSCRRIAYFARAGMDIILIGDDIGMQHTIMMSGELYRKWLKPRLAKVIASAKACKPDIIVAYHSCGYVEPFIDDLIECGIDVLNPVQPECMDFADIHRKYGDRLSFWGTIGTQTTMPFGTPDEVWKTVRRNLAIAGPAGGLLCTPTHLLEPEVPWANIEAYMQACKSGI